VAGIGNEDEGRDLRDVDMACKRALFNSSVTSPALYDTEVGAPAGSGVGLGGLSLGGGSVAVPPSSSFSRESSSCSCVDEVVRIVSAGRSVLEPISKRKSFHAWTTRTALPFSFAELRNWSLGSAIRPIATGGDKAGWSSILTY